MPRRPHPTFPCPNCGAPVRKGARSCRECGSDAQTGWAEEAEFLGVDIPTGYGGEESFDYEDWLRGEVAELGRPWWRRPALWRRAALAIFVAILAWLLIWAGAG